ncbi:hypothetical protein HPB52_006077 [Rhipicephalus sanguineus]|uniref:Nlr family card domain protein n=1 Tax=Rhipicephalus sanguineus TaxID=34632 RepID=A0A9D4Q553_RHISA|nr:hypothetical protein HPB52_006077 [Rhipicephalus sanguineus]
MAKGFSGSSINCFTPCTSSEGQLCHIFRDIALWNKLFWQVGLQSREFFPGELSLIGIYDAYVPRGMPEQLREAATLLQHFLTLHHCVVSLDLNSYMFTPHYELMCDTLRKSPSLRKLKVHLRCMENHLSQRLAAALPHMSHLRELDCGRMHYDCTFLKGLSEFLASTVSLKTLALGHLHIACGDVIVVLEGLKRNATVTTLSLNSCILGPASSQGDDTFHEYLCHNHTLHTLSVTSCHLCNFADVCRITGALFHNRTICELNLCRFPIDSENIQLISGLLCKNVSLRRFSVNGCVWYNPAPQYGADCSVRYLESFGSVSSRIYPWLVALTKNKTLEELTLNLTWFNTDELRSLFKAIASHTCLKKVFLMRVRDEDVAEICKAMRDVCVQERCFVGVHLVYQNTVGALTECKELSSIIVNSTNFRGFDPLLTTLLLLPSCSHVTSVCLMLCQELFNGQLSSLIAQYITATVALRELELTFLPGFGTWNAVGRPERELVQALSVNKSVRRLFIKGLCFDETETQILADTLQSSRTLCKLSFFPDEYESTVSLIQKLSPNVSSNYTLLGMRLSMYVPLGDDWVTIAEVVSRNTSMVIRAAHFVMGTRHKYCAGAAELLHTTPGLVEKVQELASINENEAVSRINKSLQSTSELHDFMRVAGVVKESVTCHQRDDGKKQLTDLNRDCWLYLRQHLKVGDILDEQ